MVSGSIQATAHNKDVTVVIRATMGRVHEDDRFVTSDVNNNYNNMDCSGRHRRRTNHLL